jgi:branched-chain amino acid transport system ATP-binding protein
MKADVEPRPIADSASAIAAGEVLLSLEHVSLSFGGVRALRDVSFDIKKGEIRAIIASITPRKA